MSIVNAPASTQQMGILTRKIIVIVLMQALDYNSSFSRRFLLFYKIHSTTIVFFFPFALVAFVLAVLSLVLLDPLAVWVGLWLLWMSLFSLSLFLYGTTLIRI